MNVTDEQIFSLTGSKFLKTDPRSWKDREDVIIFIGNSLGSNAARFNQLQMMSQDISQIVTGGGLGRLVDEQNVFNLINEKAKIMGYLDGTLFVNDPSQLPPPQEEGPSAEDKMFELEQSKLMLEVEKLKVQVEKEKAEIQRDVAKLQLEKQKFEHEKALDEARFQLDVEELDIERTQERPVKIGK
jgi:hypothetical protein